MDSLDPAPPDTTDTRGPETIDDWPEVLADTDACSTYGLDSSGEPTPTPVHAFAGDARGRCSVCGVVVSDRRHRRVA